jgi:hypothetical protein
MYFAPLCDLLEKTGVNLLPAEVGGTGYRNDNAALIFLQYIAAVLHDNLMKKFKKVQFSVNILDHIVCLK